MGITFTKAVGAVAKGVAGTTATEQQNKSVKAGSGLTWFKKGKALSQAIDEEDARQQEAFEASKRLFRFRIKEGEEHEARITFVDGFLDEDGLLDCIGYREHHLYLNGTWGHFYTCVAENEPCPVCESGDSPSLVSVLTVMDHRSFKTKNGLEIPWSKKLFVCKRNTHKILQNMAAKRGGLAGCTFDVLRVGDNSSNVGSQFDFVQKDEIKELESYFIKEVDGKQVTQFSPASYAEEIPYHTGAELRQKGFGAKTPIGSEKPLQEDSQPAGTNYASQL